jgi:hypothetical protein
VLIVGDRTARFDALLCPDDQHKADLADHPGRDGASNRRADARMISKRRSVLIIAGWIAPFEPR